MRWFLKLAQWLKSLSTFVGNTLTNLSENSVFFKYCVKTSVKYQSLPGSFNTTACNWWVTTLCHQSQHFKTASSILASGTECISFHQMHMYLYFDFLSDVFITTVATDGITATGGSVRRSVQGAPCLLPCGSWNKLQLPPWPLQG